MILRPYQNDCFAACCRHYRTERSGLVALPTGCGKTVVFAKICSIARKPSLIIAHRRELLTQAADKIRAFVPDAAIGLIRRDSNEWDKRFVVASVQTLSQPGRLADIPVDQYGLVIIDEAHHATSPSYRKIINHFNEAKLIGFSATPYRLDGDGLDEIFGDKPIFTYEIQQAVKDGYLVPPRAWLIRLNVDLDHVHTVAGDFNNGELATAMNSHENSNTIIESWQQHADDRRTIVFAVNVQHAQDIASAFASKGIAAECVDGGMDDDRREDLFKRFKAGHIRVLTNCMICTEGYDDAGVGCVVMARPTKSRALFTQCVGRGLRLDDGKTDCILLDCVGATRRHKLAGVHHLFGIEKQDLDGHTPEEIEEEEAESGDRQIADACFNGKLSWTAQPVSLFLKDTLTTYIPCKDWHFRPASDRQLAALGKFGLDFGDAPPNCGAASVLLDALIAEADAEPATPKQKAFLERHGFKGATATKRQASQLIAEIKSTEAAVA